MKIQDRFNINDCQKIADWCHISEWDLQSEDTSRHSTKIDVDYIQYDLESLREAEPSQQAMWIMDHGLCEEELIIKINDGDFKVTISDDGTVTYANFSDCQCRMQNALNVYKLITERFSSE